MAINRKPKYDADDMKVMLDGGRLTEIGKTLPLEAVDAEAIGFYYFQGEGPRRYVETLETIMREPVGLRQWFPYAVGEFAKHTDVAVCEVAAFEWCEVDFPADLQQAIGGDEAGERDLAARELRWLRSIRRIVPCSTPFIRLASTAAGGRCGTRACGLPD